MNKNSRFFVPFSFCLIFFAGSSPGMASRPDSTIAGECKAGKVTVQALQNGVDRYVRQLHRLSPDKHFSASEMAEIEASTLTDLLYRKIFLTLAAGQKLQVLDSEVKERYFIVCSGLFDNDEKAFLGALLQDGWTETEYMENLREIIVSEKMRALLTADITVSDKEVRAYYDAHTPDYEIEEMELSHLLITAPDRDAPERGLKTLRTELSEKGVPPESLEAKSAAELAGRLAKTEGLLDSLKAGRDFSDLARRYSEDGTREQGGTLGWVARGRMVKAFEEAAFSLSKGQVSGVVRTEFGFHLIKALSENRRRLQDFSEVESSLRAKLQSEKEAARLLKLEKKWKVRRYGIFTKG
jgi:parvulin-like peptidyl-prolyl isomerase